MLGVAHPIKRCVKAFFLWPATHRNLLAFKASKSRSLADVLSRYEGGLLHIVDTTVALHIPAAALHAVITLIPGFLVTKGFTHQTTIGAVPKYLPYADKSSIEPSLDRWQDAVLAASLDDIVEAWDDAEAIVQRTSKSFRRELQKTWATQYRQSHVAGSDEHVAAINRYIMSL